jgi:hypothetical protein
MMKHLKYIVFIVLILAMACTHEWIEKGDELTFKESTITSTQDLEKIVAGAYFLFSSDHNALQDNPAVVYKVMSDNVSILSDNPSGSSDYRKAYLRQTSDNTLGFLDDIWEIGYKLANSASIAISHYLENGAFDDEYADQTSRIIGEAYFLRAYAHFELVRFFAPPYSASNRSIPGIPLRAEAALNAEPLEVVTVGEVYDSIVSDLRNAINLLPEAYDATHPTEYARGTRVKKDAARCLLAKVYFQMGEGTTYNGLNAWELALGLMNTVIDNPTGISKRNYYMSQDVVSVWTSTAANGTPDEVIWEYANTAWKNQKAVQTFLANNCPLTGAKPEGRTFAVSQDFLSDVGWPMPSYKGDTAGVHDVRMKYLYLYLDPADDQTAGSYFQSLSKAFIWANMFAGYASDTSLFKGYGYETGTAEANINRPVLRIAELRLLRATIYASGYGSGTPKTDMDSVLTKRGLIAEIKSGYTLADVIREHRRETAFEGRRINYLKALRMSIPVGDQAGTDPHNTDTRSTVSWDSDQLYWPVPKAEEIRNPGIINN